MRGRNKGIGSPTGQFGGGDLLRIARKRGFVQLESGVTVPMKKFVEKMVKAEQKVLFYTGRYALRVYRSTLRRKPPKKYTKASFARAGKEYQRQVEVKGLNHKAAHWKAQKKLRHTKRFMKENDAPGGLGGLTRPPYMRTGKLRNQCAFKVDGNNVYAGPPLDEGLQAYQTTRSQKKIPNLLDSGGPAMIRKVVRRSNGSQKVLHKNVTFKPHPYVKNVWNKTLPVMKKTMHRMLHK